jgi:ACR3 family arsenite transporter
MRRALDHLEAHQVPVYLGALSVGAALGLALPVVARPAEVSVTPLLMLLLYATFLGVPLTRIGAALRDARFLLTVLLTDFVLVPVVVLVLSRLVAGDRAVLVGVLFVLLCPCIDYVIVFTGLAGGAKERLLAATPLLMIGQMLLLPVFLRLLVGADVARVIDPGPFLAALVQFVVLPLLAAGLTQVLARRSPGADGLRRVVLDAMVPLMALTLMAVVASQISGVAAHIGSLARAALVFVLFAVVMVPVGMAAGKFARLDVPGRRAVMFGGVTRNSLVVLPLVLSLPAGFEISPLVVVMQTLVELLVMVAMVRLVPRVDARRDQKLTPYSSPTQR